MLFFNFACNLSIRPRKHFIFIYLDFPFVFPILYVSIKNSNTWSQHKSLFNFCVRTSVPQGSHKYRLNQHRCHSHTIINKQESLFLLELVQIWHDSARPLTIEWLSRSQAPNLLLIAMAPLGSLIACGNICGWGEACLRVSCVEAATLCGGAAGFGRMSWFTPLEVRTIWNCGGCCGCCWGCWIILWMFPSALTVTIWGTEAVGPVNADAGEATVTAVGETIGHDSVTIAPLFRRTSGKIEMRERG